MTANTDEAAPVEMPCEDREAKLVCYETYAALGTILMDLAERGHPQAEKLLDNLSQARLVHKDVLPFADPAGVRACPAPNEDSNAEAIAAALMRFAGYTKDEARACSRLILSRAYAEAAAGVWACPKCHGTGANPDFPLANCECWPTGVAPSDAPSTPKPMQGLADWLRAVAETQAADTEQEACMRQWAREVDAARGVTRPVGWQLVPVKPTEAMARAGVDAYNAHTSAMFDRVWEAMLAAAPAPAGVAPSDAPSNGEPFRSLLQEALEYLCGDSEFMQTCRAALAAGVKTPLEGRDG